MKRFVKPNQSSIPEAPKAEPGVVAGFDIVELLDKGGEILRREISNLMIESSGKKLSPNSAKDLVSYLKLLHELKEEQQKTLSELTDEELETLKAGQE
jgi:hypothetical protein